MAQYSGPASLIPEGSDVAFKVTAHLRTGKDGYHTTWGGHAVPTGTEFHPINTGEYTMRLPDDSETALLVTDAPINVRGASISQRIELAGMGDPPDIIAPPPGR